MEGSFCGRRDQNTKGEEMVRSLTLDSSVIVAALREQEEKHELCKKLLERVMIVLLSLQL
jgi:hypothetical protein